MRFQAFSRLRDAGVITIGMPEKLKLPPPFEDAMKSLGREIMRYLFRMTADREDSLDLFQETWLRAYRAYPNLKSADGLRPWVYRIASNLCRNRARDRMRRARVIAPQDIDTGDIATIADASRGILNSSQDGAIHLKRAISALPAKQGRALMMRKIEGLDYEEISAALNCSPDTARANVYQALKKLKAAT
ncbi:MAG TPA: RNA polymerase sigma factor [Candidatus Binataceae bacterium]